jgi:hypothetical protein
MVAEISTDDFFENFVQLLLVWQGKINDRRFILQLWWDISGRDSYNNGGLSVLEMLRDRPEEPFHWRHRSPDIMKIIQHINIALV